MTDHSAWTVVVSQDHTTYHEVVIDRDRLIPDGTPPAHLGTALCNLALADAATGTASHLGTVRHSPRVDDWAPANTVAAARVIARTADRILASETRTVTADEASTIRDLDVQLAAALHAHGTEAQRDTVDTTAVDTARQSCQAISTALRDTLAASARTATLDLATDTSLATSIANLDADTRQRITDALRTAAEAAADTALAIPDHHDRPAVATLTPADNPKPDTAR